MAIVTFGPEARGSDSIAIQNTTHPGVNLVFALLRSAVIAPGAYKFLTLSDFDARLRGVNLHHNMLYTVGSNGTSPYLDDVAEFCKLIIQGDITIWGAESPNAPFTATEPGSGNIAAEPPFVGLTNPMAPMTTAFPSSGTPPSSSYGFTLGEKLSLTFAGDGSVIFA